MASDNDRRLKPAADTAAIRCYNQGLGDCFLLAFPREGDPDDPFYFVIDCGVAQGTPDEEERMRQVITDISVATGGHLDALALTHQHYDHVIGFAHASDLWSQITVERLYLPWVDNPKDPEAKTIGEAAQRMGLAAQKVAEQTVRLAQNTNHHATIPLSGELLAGGCESFNVRASEGIAMGWKVALERCSEDKHVYCEPGDVLPLRGTNVKAYVLGPPRLKNRDGKDLVSRRGKPLLYLLEDRKEMYSYERVGLARDAAGFASNWDALDATLYANAENGETLGVASALLGDYSDEAEVFDRYCPFDSSLRIDWDTALKQSFFRDHYSSNKYWRRVDDDWMGAASDLALRAGGFTNNLSLVLAFELPQSQKVLLFAGDAQVGNWLSWHQIGHWWPKNASIPSGVADMNNLLGRIAFYKVGHHGSHNATISDNGLARMPEGMLAYIPVSVPVAHDVMRYCPMPFYPLLLALQQKTRGAVFLANGKLLQPLPEGANERQLEALVRTSTELLGPKMLHAGTFAEKKLEGEVPLWIEFALDDGVPT